MYSLNRKTLGTLAFGLIAAVGASGAPAHGQTVIAAGGHHDGGPQMAGGIAQMALPRGIANPLFSPGVLSALDLTSDQKTAIASLLTTYQSTAQPLQKEIATDEAAAKTLYETSPYDSDSAASTAEDEAVAIGSLILAAQAVQADIYANVLTSDQQAAYVTAVSGSASTSSSSSSSSPSAPPLPTLAGQILRNSTTLSLTDDEVSALKSIESSQVTADTAALAAARGDLTDYTSEHNAASYDEDALTTAVDAAKTDIAALLEGDWAADSSAFLTLTSDQQTALLALKPSHGGGGGSGGPGGGSGGGPGQGGGNGPGSGSGSGSSGGSSRSGSSSRILRNIARIG